MGPSKASTSRQTPSGHFQHALYLTPEVTVTWGIDDVDFNILVPNRHVFGSDRNSPLTLQVIVVENQFAEFLIVPEQFRRVNNFIDQGGFTVVDVGDNGYISNGLHTN
jgi:hypothetical protein